jgi:two-component system, cell cycle sensor histidine kinase and response regulator CckA
VTHILIVDDHPENLYFLRMLLQGHDCTVEEAEDGTEALTKARQNPPDLVISDLLMPVMDGYTLLRQWRADEELRSIPFVVYTATYTEPQDERLALDLGADAFIVKPAEPEAFMESIRAVLEQEKRGVLSGSAAVMDNMTLTNSYNEVLIRKLNEQTKKLEQTNRELLDEIAERKRSQEALLLRDRAIQSVSQGIIISDPNKKGNPIVYAGPGFERITGYRQDEVLGKNCRFLQGKDTDKDTVQEIRDAVANGESCSVEILNYRRDGTPFWNALSLNPVKNESGALEYFVGVQTDITHRMRLENQLRHSQKMEAVGRLAGGVAHDFNNLLTVISGYSDLILAAPEDEEGVCEAARFISEAGNRAAALTQQLLGFSRQSMLKPEILDVNVAITEAGKLLRRLLGSDVEFATVLHPNLHQVKVDPGQLDQVLMNLAINSRDAMPDGGKLTIESSNVFLDDDYVATHLDCKAGSHVMLAVSDTGCGMKPDVVARIFEPFFTTKEKGKGTGLGMATVFGIVQQSGGCIHVYSEPGHGTMFKIYLPAVSGPAPAVDDTAARLGIRGTETILLVEDDERVRTLALASLERFGYTMLTAESGDDAMRVAEAYSGELDLLLTDVVIPNFSGPELATRVQLLFPAVRVLFMSGYTDDAVIRLGLLHGTVSFIQKPFGQLDLARKVREVLDADSPAD